MAGGVAPEEQRFDFGLTSLDEALAAPRPARRGARTSARAATTSPASPEQAPDAGDVARALQRRVEEVAAVAHGGKVARLERGAPPGGELPDGGTAGVRADRSAGASLVEDLDDADVEEAGEESLTVAQFYERVKRALARAFVGEVWVTGEIRNLSERRGHRYIELADEGAESGARAAQQLEVVCWAREWPTVAAALAAAGVSLEIGRVVRVRGRVSVWEGGSKLRFNLTALDVEALLGGIAAARHRLLQALEREGLLEANSRLAVPLVPLRIGIVTSPGSEAHRDFVGQLTRSGFAFDVHLEPSLVQGPEAPRQVAAAIGRLAKVAPDLVVVVRGGGARGDLAAFDSEEVARAIATAPFPVWTGIGHTGDRSVADEVAQRALITPTACGEAVVTAVSEYHAATLRRASVLAGLARAQLDGAHARLHGVASSLTRGTRHQLERRHDEIVAARAGATRAAGALLVSERTRLGARASLVARAGARSVSTAEQQRDRFAQVLRAYDPTRQLERGWSLTRDASGRLVTSVAALEPGETIVTRLADGEVRSEVSEVRRGPTGRRQTAPPATGTERAAPAAGVHAVHEDEREHDDDEERR